MGRARAEATIERTPADVWATIADFGGIAAWMPSLDSCRVEGENRIISMLGMEIVERLVRRDDEARVLVYSIDGGDLVLEHHLATISVTPSGSGTLVTWDVDVKPDELTDTMLQTYQGALGALEQYLTF